ncbi:MAG: hypothetical protein HOO96_19880 [Polyangiaceae bacterium]|nr:hypothetical protein [Polyangiaceae bacterium]
MKYLLFVVAFAWASAAHAQTRQAKVQTLELDDDTKTDAAKGDGVKAPPKDEPKPDTAKTDGGKTDAPKIDAVDPSTGDVKTDPSKAGDGKGRPKFTITPYVGIAAGIKYDNVQNREGETRQDRVVTFAIGRFGLLARYTDHFMVQSELMASGGIGLHGTSAYEGQAALQVRQQMLRATFGRFTLEAGRLVDEASVDYISNYVQGTFVQDTATRDPLLYSGYNLGNGVRAVVDIIPGMLRAGLTFNAGNPVSNTATLMVGGTYPPFERIYTQAYQAVNQGPNHFPDDTFHAMVLTPSVLLSSEYVDAKVAFQAFAIDTNTNTPNNDHVRGYNMRGTVRGKFGMVVPFASAAYTRNDTLIPNNVATRSPDRYQAINLGGGVDVNLAKRFTCEHECTDGLGAQFQQVQYEIGDGVVTTLRYANLGGTFWVHPHFAIDARVSYWWQNQKGIDDTGERNLIVGVRGVLP